MNLLLRVFVDFALGTSKNAQCMCTESNTLFTIVSGEHTATIVKRGLGKKMGHVSGRWGLFDVTFWQASQALYH